MLTGNKIWTIVLTAEGFKFMLVEECPINSINLIDDQTKVYDKSVKADEMTRYYILSSMKKVLQHQHKFMTYAYYMLKSLKNMLGEKNHCELDRHEISFNHKND